MEEKSESLQKLDPPTVGLVSAAENFLMISNILSQNSAESISPGFDSIWQENIEAAPSNSDKLANSNNKETHKVDIAGSDKAIRPSHSKKASFSSQGTVAVTGPPTIVRSPPVANVRSPAVANVRSPAIVNVWGSKFPSSSRRPGPLQTPDRTPKSLAALIEELRESKDVEDLTGQFEHTSRRLVARGGYSEVHFTHWLDPTRTDSIPVR